jgi:glucosamine--fructose-6-phosphate aminotransferase (isomerizing)
MYDMIKEIPASFAVVLEQLGQPRIPKGDRIAFTGNGTAFYSAWMGSDVLSELRIPHRVVQSFEFEHYIRPLKNELVVGVSHSGITKSTIDSLRRAKHEGATPIGLTHFAGRPIEEVCDLTLVIGDGPDMSRCHTKTYIDSAAAVALVGCSFARLLGKDPGDCERQLASVEGKLKQAVADCEDQAKQLVAGLPDLRQVVFAGAGPNLVTAREAALKVKESCYLPSEGIELEEEAHGPWVALDGSSLLVMIAPDGASLARSKNLLAAAKKVGCRTVIVSDAVEGRGEADNTFLIPRGPEYLSPFLTIIPLYFVAYFLSVRLGNNPDYLRYLDPRYWDARKHIFPPGTH